MASVDIIDNVISTLDNIRSLERIKSRKTEIDLKSLTKRVYDFTKEQSRRNTDALPELVTEGFDEEQIWQQLELQNESEISHLKSKLSNKISKLLSGKKKLTVPVSSTKPKTEPVQIENDNFHEENGDTFDDKESDNENIETKTILKKRKREAKQKSVVDDKFFKLEELTEYLTKEERKEKQKEEDENESDDSVDLFISEEENDNVEGKYMKYADFFDSPESENELNQNKTSNKDSEREGSEDEEDMSNEEEDGNKPQSKKVRFNLTNDSDETDSLENKANKKEEQKEDDEEDMEEEDTESKSTLEARQERLKMRIQELEEEAMSEKPWQLKGEVSGLHRPQNSLLEEFVEFDITKRPPPVITEETTIKLEDIIMQRIKDKTWDDVEKKFKPVETPLEYKKKLVLDQEKSKESLSQIYEKEYLRQKKALNPDNEDDEKKEESSQLHNEIRHMMRSLIAKLDALSHYHYTPKLAKPEIKIISNVPAINMEEVAPVATSDATLLAPEEIKAKPQGDLIGRAERTKTDMKRERRKKKSRQRAKQQAIEKKEKLKPGISKKSRDKKEKEALLKKVTKDRNVTKLNETTHKVAKSSTAFFTQLQDQVKGKNTKAKQKDKKTVSAVKLKL